MEALKVYKKVILSVFSTLALIWKLIPFKMRKYFFYALFILESRGKQPKEALVRLFTVEDLFAKVINERALAYGSGEHPKHHLIPYHQFFIENLNECSGVVDIGCGYGAVARSVARALPNMTVLGIDNNHERFEMATKGASFSNLQFQLIDVDNFLPAEKYDAVILSNVLEHLVDRRGSLLKIKEIVGAKRFLIRVPMFERHWSIALRDELGINYYQDDDHKIEHRVDEFKNEMMNAGLAIEKMETVWGEIWAVCSPI
jgi:SAM-dependent methyltransferase